MQGAKKFDTPLVSRIEFENGNENAVIDVCCEARKEKNDNMPI